MQENSNLELTAGTCWKYIPHQQRIKLTKFKGAQDALELEIAKSFHLQNYPQARHYNNPQPNLFLTMLNELRDKTPKYLLAKEILLSCHTKTAKESLLGHPKLQPNVSVLNAIIQAELWHVLPNEHLTTNTLCAQDGNGDTALHYLARTGGLKKVSEANLTEENMLITNKQGSTPLYEAAIYGMIVEVPKVAFTAKTLCAGPSAFHPRPNNGEPIYNLIAARGRIDVIPDGVLNGFEWFKSIHTTVANGYGHLIQKGQLTREALLFSDQVYCQNSKHRNTLSLIAGTQGIKNLPDITTSNDWIVENKDGSSAIAVAIAAQQVEYLPLQALTPEVLLHKQSNTSIIQLIVERQMLAKLPPSCIVKELFSQRESSTPLILEVIKTKQTQHIPKDIFQYALDAKYNQISKKPVLTKDGYKLSFSEESVPVLELALEAALPDTSIFLGLNIPDKYRQALGEEWWEENEEIKRKLSSIVHQESSEEIDIF